MNDPGIINWEEVHRRIHAVSATVEKGFNPTSQEEQDILRRRAQRLAQEPEAAELPEDVLEAIEFELASEHYAIPLAQVSEVSLLKELTPVPCTPPFVLGIINLRGEIRTVVDLKKFFDLPDKGITELNKIILIRQEDMQLGILADAICGVRRISLHSLQPAPATLTGIRADYLRGVTGDRLVVLDAVRILSDPRLLVDHKDEA